MKNKLSILLTVIVAVAATAVGVYDVTIAVTDQGLPPQDAGYANPDNPLPNLSWQTLRIVVQYGTAQGVVAVGKYEGAGQCKALVIERPISTVHDALVWHMFEYLPHAIEA